MLWRGAVAVAAVAAVFAFDFFSFSLFVFVTADVQLKNLREFYPIRCCQ